MNLGDFTVCPTEIDTRPSNMFLLKNPQFLPNYYETLSKLPTIELIILTKFYNDWVKTVDFLLIT